MTRLNTNLPALRELRLKHWNDTFLSTEIWTIPTGPGLRCLSLKDVRFQWNALPLEGLHSLHLHLVQAPPIPELLHIVSSSPQLEILVLSGLFPRPLASRDIDQSSIGGDQHPISLRCLKTLHITSVPADLSRYLLHHINSLVCRHVVCDNVPLASLTNPYSSFMSTILSPICASDGIEILVSERGREIRLSTIPKWKGAFPADTCFAGIDIQTTSNDLFEGLESVLKTLEPISTQTALHLSFEAPRLDRSMEVRGIPSPSPPTLVLPTHSATALSAVDSIKFRGDIDVHALFRYLAQPRLDVREGGNSPWPGQRLKMMDFGSWDGPNCDLFHFVMQRWGGPVGLRPEKLERLILPGDNRESVSIFLHAAQICEARSD